MNVSIKDRTTGKYWGGTAFDQSSQTFNAATVAGNNWSYALDESELTAPHAYLVELYSVDNVGNTEVHQQIRFTYGSDIGAPTTTLTLTGATHAYPDAAAPYVLYYGTALGGGGFTLHAVRDRPERRRHDRVPGSLRHHRLQRLRRHLDERLERRSVRRRLAGLQLHERRHDGTGPRRTSTSTDLRGNSGNDSVTFVLDNTRADRRLAHRERRQRLLDERDVPGQPPRLHRRRRRLRRRLVRPHRRLGDARATARAARSARPSAAVDGVVRRRADGTCYRFTLTGTDNVGNVASISADVKVDTTPPSQPSVVFGNLSSGNTFDNGAGTLYYRPSAGGTFTRQRERLDRSRVRRPDRSGYTFSPLTGFASTTPDRQPLDVTFNGASNGGGAYTVHATNNAGLDSTTRRTTSPPTRPRRAAAA